MGGKAFNAWEKTPFEYIEHERLLIPAHRRPSAKNVELTCRIVVQNMPELHNGTVFGDCDETHEQISERAHGFLSVGEVSASLRVVDGSVFLITQKPAKGRNGTHRTFNPGLPSLIATWKRGGAEPTPQEVALWDERLYGRGCRPQRFGIERQQSEVSPTPPIEGPITDTYKRPKSGRSSINKGSPTSGASVDHLLAELHRLDDAQRATSDPQTAQQASFGVVEVLSKLRQLGVNNPWSIECLPES